MRHLLSSLLLLIAATVPVYAHDPRPGPNGGVMVDAGTSFHVELVATGTEAVTVYLFDAADKPVATVGFNGNAILILDGKAQRFALEPVAEAKFTGKAPAAVQKDVKGVIQITGPDGTSAQAKF